MSRNESTCILLKPETIERNLIGEIIARFERASLQVDAIDLRVPDRKTAAQHYPPELADRHSEQIREWAISHLAGSKVVPAIVSGTNAISSVRALVGESFDPSDCSPGTIRRDYSVDSASIAEAETRSIKNIVHAADSEQSAQREIAIWFPDR